MQQALDHCFLGAVLSRRLMVSSDIWRDIGNLIASSCSLAKVIARYKINK